MSGPPKASESVTLAQLKTLKVTVTSAKSVGGGTIKLFTDGPRNFYVSDGEKLREWLQQTFKVQP